MLQPGSNVVTTEPSEPPLTQPPAISTATTNPLATTQLSLATATAGGAVTQEPFSPGPCQECYCTHDTDPVTKLNIIKCSAIVCNTSCSEVTWATRTHTRLQVIAQQRWALRETGFSRNL